MCSSESIRNKTKLQVLLLQNSCKCVLAARALPSVSWLRMHKAAITQQSACSSGLVSLLCLTGIHSTGPSSVQGGSRSMKDGSKEENDTQTESHHPLRIKGSILHREDGLMTYKKKNPKFKICYY